MLTQLRLLYLLYSNKLKLMLFLAILSFSFCYPKLVKETLAAIQLTGKSDVPSLAKVCNPKPSVGDIILPMPAGLTMVLRAVSVPTTGYLDDSEQTLGIAASAVNTDLNNTNTSTNSPTQSLARAENLASTEAYTERQYSVALNAIFEINDIPEAWGAEIKQFLARDPTTGITSATARGFLYFIGKYEVSRGQWRAIMALANNTNNKPFKLEAGDDQPMTEITWFEVQEFNRLYSEWLMREHPEYLPFFQLEQRSAYIRLPTEAEWEYAARGGHKVTAAERERTRLYPMAEDSTPQEYIIASLYDSTLANSVAIASRKANPLELYDMLGNVAEMVQTPFYLVTNGRLMASPGGFVIKGGSWRSFTLSSLHPGRRLEAAYYIQGKAQKRDDLGLRICLGSIVSPKDRHEAIKAEWQRRSKPQAANARPEQDVRLILRALMKQTDNRQIKQQLAEAEAIASTYYEQVNTSEEKMLREMLLGAIFSLETIANYASRCYLIIKNVDTRAAMNRDAEQLKQIAEREYKNASNLANLIAANQNLSLEAKISLESLVAESQKTAEEIEAYSAPILLDKEQKEKDKIRQIEGFLYGIRGALYYYRNLLKALVMIDQARLAPQLDSLTIQFSHADGFSKSLARRLKVLKQHLEALANGQDYTEEQDLQDLLPDWLSKRLLEYWQLIS